MPVETLECCRRSPQERPEGLQSVLLAFRTATAGELLGLGLAVHAKLLVAAHPFFCAAFAGLHYGCDELPDGANRLVCDRT